IAFFDIQLADGLSFDIFNETDVPCPVIFCTAFDEYALQAFQVNSVDYVLKPFDRESIHRALEKVKKLENFFQKKEGRFERLTDLLDKLRISRSKNVFLVSQRDKLIPVSVSDIAYFYIEHEVTFLYTFDGRRFIVNHTLDELEKMLDPVLFYRANRQFLVNVKSVTEVEQYFARKLLLKLNTQTREPVVVSKAKASDFLQWMESR
ncbi:MAG: response regulator transcription factor, partial [Saprospiraceae bacterium]|nr:response regulator transcription factor [Saprospiraceae bacterium]